jgi:multicomponent Na+:H+ antiporter subunit E
MKYIPIILIFTLTYVALTSNLEPLNILVGLLIAAGVTALVRPPVRSRTVGQSLRSLLAGFRYIGVLTYDLLVSGLQTARMVLSPSLPIKPGVLTIPSNTQTDLGAALSAHAITLTPGEMVVEMDADNNMYTHVLDVTKAEAYLHDAQEMRRTLLNEIFP